MSANTKPSKLRALEKTNYNTQRSIKTPSRRNLKFTGGLLGVESGVQQTKHG